MKTSILTTVILLFVGHYSHAQELLTPSFMFTDNKPSYITLADGSEITGKLKDVDRKKGQIESIEIVDDAGKKHKLSAAQIKNMYVYPTGFDKVAKANKIINDATKWKSNALNDRHLTDGYVYFETTNVVIGKKQHTLLLQLLNPTFSKFIKVFYDPFAKETKSFGIGPVKLAGGIDKSYYVSKNNATAVIIEKSDYAKKDFETLYAGCTKLLETPIKDRDWSDLVKHIISFNDCQ